MKACLIKDYYLSKEMMRHYLLFVVLYTGIGLFMKNYSLVVGLAIMIPMMLPINTLAFDERSRFERFAISSNIRREEIVLAKYVLALIGIALASLYVFSIVLIATGDLAEALSSAIPSVFLATVSTSFALPVIFKFGVEKGRLWMLVAMAIPVGLFGLVFVFYLNILMTHTLLLICGAFVVTSLILIGSIRLSSSFVKNKNY